VIRVVMVASVALGACSGPDSEPVSFAAPARAGFEGPSNVLHGRCGSLDCHGQITRSLRVYGQYGLRLAASDGPGGVETTAAEHDENYRSVLALEPEELAAVTAQSGARPERLTLIRKARGVEAHKGGTVFGSADPGDRCLTSWLAGNVDAEACDAGRELARPE
jgi:hypothetical protein